MSIQQIQAGLGAYQKMAGLEIPTDKNLTPSNTTDATNANTLTADKITTHNDQQASLVAHLFGGDPRQVESNSAKMVYQAAMAKLNEILSPKDQDGNPITVGDAPISQATLDKQGGMDYWTPENTADRIIKGSTAFLASFEKAHPELEGEALINKFMDVVGGGLTQGFNEAKGILGELKVFDGDIKDNFTKTTDLVQKGMQDFKNNYLGIKPEATPPSENKGNYSTNP